MSRPKFKVSVNLEIDAPEGTTEAQVAIIVDRKLAWCACKANMLGHEVIDVAKKTVDR